MFGQAARFQSQVENEMDVENGAVDDVKESGAEKNLR
jgi:hypothetical protein